MTRFCLVWFIEDKTSCVVPTSDIEGDCGLEQIVEVRWPGDPKTYAAKVIYSGSKIECDKKLKFVKLDGSLAGHLFDVAPSAPKNTTIILPISSPSVPPATVGTQPSLQDIFSAIQNLTSKVDECLANQNEIVRRLRLVENSTSTRAANEKSVASQLNEITFSTNNACDQLQHVIRKLPQKAAQGSIDYIFASKAEVEGIRTLRPDYKKFAMDLERMVYRGEEDQLSLLVEKRVTTADRVDFIKSCVNHFYAVPIESRETVWRDVRTNLNARSRRQPKNSQNGTPTSRRLNVSSNDFDTSFYTDHNSPNTSISTENRAPTPIYSTPRRCSYVNDPYLFE